jgi:Zn-finger nucleic acid-binding protein
MYRDEHERCPRCHVELIDAGAVRACTNCRGQWATHEVLFEMALNMTRPDRPHLPFYPHTRKEQLACPSCGKPMGTWKLRKVELDKCEPHGIWFDRDELEDVLFATFDAERTRDDDA